MYYSPSPCQGTHARMEHDLQAADFALASEHYGTAYVTGEVVPVNHPFLGGGFLSNKKWPLNEESTKHINNSALCIECVNYV